MRFDFCQRAYSYIFHNCSCLGFKAISTQEKFPRTENFPKISLLKVEFSTSKFFSDGKFVSTNHILQNLSSAENFPELEMDLN